jgi:hypothetical protein
MSIYSPDTQKLIYVCPECKWWSYSGGRCVMWQQHDNSDRVMMVEHQMIYRPTDARRTEIVDRMFEAYNQAANSYDLIYSSTDRLFHAIIDAVIDALS